MSKREIIRESVAKFGITISNQAIREFAWRNHRVEVKTNEIINTVGSEKKRFEKRKTAAQELAVSRLVSQCDGNHDFALNLIRLDRTRNQRRKPSKERKA